MVKTNKNGKRVTKPAKSTRRAPDRRASGIVRRMGVDDRVLGHAQMIIDPCRAVLKPTAYRGNDGFVQRFANVNSAKISTNSAFCAIYYPGYNSLYVVNPADGATVFNLGTGSGPGQSYLLANAASLRPVAACMQWDYIGTELNRSGQITMGSLKVGALGGSTSVDAITALLQKTERTPDHTAEVKWEPSPIDEQYWITGATPPSGDDDANLIVICGMGFVGGVDYRLKTTLIAEWMPKPNLGIANVSTSSPDAPAGLERLRTFLYALGDGWQNTMHTVAVGGRVAKQVYNSTRAASEVLALMS